MCNETLCDHCGNPLNRSADWIHLGMETEDYICPQCLKMTTVEIGAPPKKKRKYQRHGIFTKRYYKGKQLVYKLEKKTPALSEYLVVGQGELTFASKHIIEDKLCPKNKAGGI